MDRASERSDNQPMIDSIAALLPAAGYRAQDPIVVGVRQGSAPAAFAHQGRLTADTVVYTASLSKQVTAACAALLVRQGRLDTESTLARWMPELPAWAGSVRVRHLIHHTSGLPEVADFDELHRAGVDRTTARIIGALKNVDELAVHPGSEHRYCNAGYVCLAVAVERAAGRPLPAFAREHVFGPLGMRDSRYWSGPAAHPPGAAPLDPAFPAPLSLGDGGMWSTARDLMRWNQALDRDELGVSALLHTPGCLDDGSPLPYAWGVGVEEGVHRHGGRWAGLCAQLVRLPGRGAGFVILTLDDDEDRMTALAAALIDELTG